MNLSLRLIDGVAIAAAVLLGLKVVSYFTSEDLVVSYLNASAPVQEAQRSDVSKVMAYQRPNRPDLDVNVTGSVPDKKPEDKKDDKKVEAPKDKVAAKSSEPERPKDVLPTSSSSASEKALLERLGERREEIQSRTRDVDMRERLLEDAEKKLESRINDLRSMEEKAQEIAAKKGDTEASALKNLVLMYETMKPKDAAKVFERINLKVLVPVVVQMNPRKMSEVLANMSPESAEKLTVALSARARGLSEPNPVAAMPMPPNELSSVDDPNLRPRR